MKDKIYKQIQAEREQQNERWGGLAHDKQHASADWAKYIRKHLERWENETGNDKRYAMVRVAALAVAALESYDEGGLCKFEDSSFANSSIEHRR